MQTIDRLGDLESLILDVDASFSAHETLSELSTVLERLHIEKAAARDYQRCLHLIHLVNYKIERFAEAFDFGFRALSAFPEIAHLSPNALLMFPYRMGECCLHLEQFAEAIPYYERALARLKAHSQEESDAKLGTIGKIALCLHRVGRQDEALTMNRALLTRAEAYFGPTAPVLASVLGNLAANAYDTGDAKAAFDYLIRGYEISAEIPEQAYDFLYQLGVLAAVEGETAKAQEWFARQLALAESLNSADHIDEAWRNLEMLKAGAA